MSSCSSRGFTVTEVLVVLAIAGAMAVMLAPSLTNFMPRIEFEGACRQVASDISLQRLRAVERRETTSIVYNPGNRVYVLNPYGTRRPLPDAIVSLSFPQVDFNSRGLNPSGSQITITLNGVDGRHRSIMVSPAGRIRFAQP